MFERPPESGGKKAEQLGTINWLQRIHPLVYRRDYDRRLYPGMVQVGGILTVRLWGLESGKLTAAEGHAEVIGIRDLRGDRVSVIARLFQAGARAPTEDTALTTSFQGNISGISTAVCKLEGARGYFYSAVEHFEDEFRSISERTLAEIAARGPVTQDPVIDIPVVTKADAIIR